jgi:hypothetical protein
MITRIAIGSDIDRILELQSLNLYTNLSAAEHKGGFVTTPFTVAQLQKLLSQNGIYVIEQQNQVAGYVFAGSWDYYSQWAIFPYMVSRFQQLKFQGIPITTMNSFQYGPICIDAALRGSGAFLQLFEAMRSSFALRYPIGLTFINKVNARSLAAHKKLPLAIIDEFEFNSNSYYIGAFSTKKAQ